jgi:hypothetical protein
MDLGRVRALFDETMRANPSGQTGIEVERVGSLVRLTGLFSFVSFWRLTPESARSAVADQAAHFRSCGKALMWQVYDYDEPSELSPSAPRSVELVDPTPIHQAAVTLSKPAYRQTPWPTPAERIVGPIIIRRGCGYLDCRPLPISCHADSFSIKHF